MKQKKSPIELSHLYFTDYSWQHVADPSFTPADRDFDSRHDFLIDKDFAGIAAELHFYNLRLDQRTGVRRKVSILLFDATDRVLIATKQITVRMSASDRHLRKVVAFPFEETDFRSGHAFRLQVRDDYADQPLGEGCFRTYMEGQYGDPAKWYEPLTGALVPDGEKTLLKSFDRDSHETKVYRVRFEVMDALRGDRPDVMPELEVRLYSPERLIDDPCADNVMVNFIEPRNAYRGDLTYIVELPIGPRLSDGVYYAELLCMDCPIAGFAFTSDRDVEGSWTDAALQPLDEYDQAAANRRFNETITESSDDSDLEAKKFDDLLEAFISSQFREDSDDSDDSESSDDSDDSDFSENSDSSDSSDDPEDSDIPAEDLLAALDSMTGLESVKEKVRGYDSLIRFCMLRARKGLEMVHAPLHSMFLGSPGTGKTTVAKLMGRMLKNAGVLSKGHVVMRERSTLLGQYYHSEAEKTLAAIEEAQGGILFIDEAHSLFQANDPKDPGKFVIEALLTALADPEKDDWMLILAGYADEMHNLFKLNPGFKSRIPDSNIYTFEDFSEKQLLEIAERRLEHLDFILTQEAREALERRIATDYAHRDRTFGNARHVMNIVNAEIIPTMAKRVMGTGLTDRQSLQEIHPEDIPQPNQHTRPLRRPLGFHYLQCS